MPATGCSRHHIGGVDFQIIDGLVQASFGGLERQLVAVLIGRCLLLEESDIGGENRHHGKDGEQCQCDKQGGDATLFPASRQSMLNLHGFVTPRNTEWENSS